MSDFERRSPAGAIGRGDYVSRQEMERLLAADGYTTSSVNGYQGEDGPDIIADSA